MQAMTGIILVLLGASLWYFGGRGFETISDIFPTDDFYMFVALGYTNNNKKREGIFNEVKNKGYTCISYVHPSNIISKNFKFGEILQGIKNSHYFG